jgi:uncharacterized protein (DUF924 family)
VVAHRNLRGRHGHHPDRTRLLVRQVTRHEAPRSP